MLERTAGHLKVGSLRNLLPACQKPRKSRRMLHSGFWSHGATELEYSNLWAALMRHQETTADEQVEPHVQSVANSSVGGFLEFLYPLGALRLLRQYSLWKSDTKDAQRTHPSWRKLGQRLYASTATKTLGRLAEDFANSPNMEPGEHNSTISVIQDSSLWKPVLKMLNALESTENYDKVWQKFKMIDVRYRRPHVSALLQYLSNSNRIVDAERAASTFEDVGSTATYKEYRFLIKLYLNCDMLQNAMDLHCKGLTKFGIPVGLDILLAFALEQCRWPLAFDVFAKSRSFHEAHPSSKYNIWGLSDKLHDLPDRVIQLSGYIGDQMTKSPDAKPAQTMSSLATTLATRALLLMARTKTVEFSKFDALHKVLHHWDADTSEFYETMIEKLLEIGHAKLAVVCYQRYRIRSSKKISHPILDKMLYLACKHHSVLGMQQVVDDWARFHSIQSEEVYRMSMIKFARAGDLDTVKVLFKQYTHVRGGEEEITNPNDLIPLLVAHSNRGELSQVVEIFNSIKSKCGREPTLKCWNVLINAYGKLLDVNGAFAQFQKLLATSMTPNDYTYGTLMGICTTRGDLDQTLTLYRMAERQGVAITPAMIDCLVLGFIREGRVLQAERICTDALTMGFKTRLTRMWNQILIAYAMRGDLENTSRVFRRMYQAGVEYDGATYSALMQALIMVRQPDRAKAILDIMREEGVMITSFHYAVIMGGYIATGEMEKVFQVNDLMLRANKQPSISTRLMMLKAEVVEDTKRFASGSQDELWKLAGKYFYDAYTAPDARERVESMRKGVGYVPLDVAYLTSHFSYLIFILGQRKFIYHAQQIYERYLDNLPSHHQHELPLKILSALMLVCYNNQDYGSVQKLWDLSFEKAIRQDQPIGVPQPGRGYKCLRKHKEALAYHLSIQMLSLLRQGRINNLCRTVKMVQKAGFELHNKNWNTYIQCLVMLGKYRTAFHLCEIHLMAGFTGSGSLRSAHRADWKRWGALSWDRTEHNRLARTLRQLRRRKRTPNFKRPSSRTLRSLSKAYRDIQLEAEEISDAYDLQTYLEKSCSRTLNVLKTIDIMDSDNAMGSFTAKGGEAIRRQRIGFAGYNTKG